MKPQLQLFIPLNYIVVYRLGGYFRFALLDHIMLSCALPRCSLPSVLAIQSFSPQQSAIYLEQKQPRQLHLLGCLSASPSLSLLPLFLPDSLRSVTLAHHTLMHASARTTMTMDT